MILSTLIKITPVLALLAGCAGTNTEIASGEMPNCIRGDIDADRTFIVCEAKGASDDAAIQTMMYPADPDLDIASIASAYGVTSRGLMGIEAATYSRIVGKTPEHLSKKPQETSSILTIEGRTFRKVSLGANSQKPLTLYVET